MGIDKSGEPWRWSFRTTPDITLRDYFAAAAMQGMVSTDSSTLDRRIAGAAYNMADAMLVEKQRREGAGAEADIEAVWDALPDWFSGPMRRNNVPLPDAIRRYVADAEAIEEQRDRLLDAAK